MNSHLIANTSLLGLLALALYVGPATTPDAAAEETGGKEAPATR